MDYRHPPDVFRFIPCEGWQRRAENLGSRQTPTKLSTNTYLLSKEPLAGYRPPAFKRIRRSSGGLPEQSECNPCRRKESKNRGSVSAGRESRTRSCIVSMPPTCRREVAGSGGREAKERRSEIDRSGGLGKPRECHAMMETASTPYGATPAQDDTLTLVPRDRRGARTGVAPDLRRVATQAPARCARRRHDRGAVRCSRLVAG